MLSKELRQYLQGLFRIFEILHDKRKASVAEHVWVADEKELDLEFHRLAEFEFVDRVGADQIALGANADGLIRLAEAVRQPSDRVRAPH